MLYPFILLTVLVTVLAFYALRAHIELRYLKGQVDLERRETTLMHEWSFHVNRGLEKRNEKLSNQLADAYKSLEVALGASPSQFNDVSVELGLHGVVYQFHALDKESAA